MLQDRYTFTAVVVTLTIAGAVRETKLKRMHALTFPGGIEIRVIEN
jgi:hypothetical protein